MIIANFETLITIIATMVVISICSLYTHLFVLSATNKEKKREEGWFKKYFAYTMLIAGAVEIILLLFTAFSNSFLAAFTILSVQVLAICIILFAPVLLFYIGKAAVVTVIALITDFFPDAIKELGEYSAKTIGETVKKKEKVKKK